MCAKAGEWQALVVLCKYQAAHILLPLIDTQELMHYQLFWYSTHHIYLFTNSFLEFFTYFDRLLVSIYGVMCYRRRDEQHALKCYGKDSPNHVSFPPPTAPKHKAWLHFPASSEVSKGHLTQFWPNGMWEEVMYSIFSLSPLNTSLEILHGLSLPSSARWTERISGWLRDLGDGWSHLDGKI